MWTEANNNALERKVVISFESFKMPSQKHFDICESCWGWGSGAGQVSGGGWRPWGDRACVSHMIWALGLHTDSHRQTKADWKQRLAVYYFCCGMSVRNSPLICFILFFEVVTPNTGWDVFRGVVSQSPPSRSPVPVLMVSELQRRITPESAWLTQHVYLQRSIMYCTLQQASKRTKTTGYKRLTPPNALGHISHTLFWLIKLL